MDELQGAHEVLGSSERHHVVLPSFPNYRVSCLGGQKGGKGPQQQQQGCSGGNPTGEGRGGREGGAGPDLAFFTCPASWQELTEEDAEKLAALLEKRLGKRFEDIELEDMTPEVTQEVRPPAPPPGAGAVPSGHAWAAWLGSARG